MVQHKTWPYGTVKPGTVHRVYREKTAELLVFWADEGEAFALVDRVGTYADSVRPGTRGTITFTRGGPFGGHWKFKAQAE